MMIDKIFRATRFLIIMAASIALWAKGFDHFITVRDNKLMDSQEEFRFISFNIPNLNFVEDELAFTRTHAYGLPTEYEIRDALLSVKQMGGRVVRTYTIPVRNLKESQDIPKYVLAPGEFDTRAFRCMDTMLAVANEVGIRLIVPLLNNWKWMGGRPQYAAFRDKSEDEFWSDPQLIADFKRTVEYVLNRKNAVTGIKYKEDKAILCWETGNELQSPKQWTNEIIDYIKSIDSNHLVMDGGYSWFLEPQEKTANNSPADIVTTHHYEKNARLMIRHIDRAIERVKKSDKAYIIGEFGFLQAAEIARILDKTIASQYIAGSLIWSLRYHRATGGYYWHSEPHGRGLYKAYHWPGFDSGREYQEHAIMQLMREKAYEIQKRAVPELSRPDPPILLNIAHVARISWKGSAGACGYHIERSGSQNGPWQRVGENISDTRYPYCPLFHDESAVIGASYYYRVIALNKAGESTPSNIIGPMKVVNQALIDNLDNFSKIYHHNGNLQISTQDDRKFKEDMFRMAVDKNCIIVYRVPGKIVDFSISLFSPREEKILELSASKDGSDFHKIELGEENYFAGKGYYDYWIPILYKLADRRIEGSYLKLRFRSKSQLSRVEVYYEKK